MLATAIAMTDEEKNILKDESSTNEIIEVLGQKYYLKEYIGEGMKSIVWRGISDFSNTPVVIKFAIKRDYVENIYLAEIRKAATLYQYPQFAKYYGAQEIKYKEVDCVVFIEEFINGKTLKKFEDITPSFIESYIRQFCIILNILKVKRLRHDDLNVGNIMIVPPPEGDFSNEYSIKVIDMGSLKSNDETLKASKNGFDDLKRFCTHLTVLSNKLLNSYSKIRKPLSRKEKMYRGVIKKILPLILEDDQNIALSEPEKIQDIFAAEFSKSMRLPRESLTTIDTPFDFISADHIGSDVLLNELFATSCPWLIDVKNNTPVLLTGPRGCGKSMIFRWLSFKSILAKGDPQSIVNTSIVGFYISCSSDLRNRFSLYDTDIKSAQAKEEIVHYFNLLLTREIVYTLSLMAHNAYSKELFEFSPALENEIYGYFITSLNLEKSKTYLQGSRPFDHLYDIIVREMNECYRIMLKRNKVSSPTSLSYLSDITIFLKSKIDFFATRTITFLLDDYSLHRISKHVQIILNPILWERQSNHIFKVSSEKWGMVSFQESNSESYSSTTDLSREYREIDVGERYVTLSDRETISDLIDFCRELLDHRLKLANYKGTTSDLIGRSDYGSHSTLEKALRNKSKDEKKDYDEYHGIDTIAKICSGDISALLETYRRIFKEGDINRESTRLVLKTKQNKAIQSTSRAFLDIIKSFNYGLIMYDIVNNFGHLSRKILQEGKLHNNGLPQVTTRIEVDELDDIAAWRSELRELFVELIHRSIFISLEQGRGRKTLGSTLRIQLRRIYCPHFKTGLTKTVAVKLSNLEFKLFLTDPKSFCDDEFEKRWSLANNRNNGNSIDQPTLFS